MFITPQLLGGWHSVSLAQVTLPAFIHGHAALFNLGMISMFLKPLNESQFGNLDKLCLSLFHIHSHERLNSWTIVLTITFQEAAHWLTSMALYSQCRVPLKIIFKMSKGGWMNLNTEWLVLKVNTRNLNFNMHLLFPPVRAEVRKAESDVAPQNFRYAWYYVFSTCMKITLINDLTTIHLLARDQKGAFITARGQSTESRRKVWAQSFIGYVCRVLLLLY